MAERRTLAERTERRTDRVARRIVDRLVADIPTYAELPREQIAGEILAIARRNVRLFAASLRGLLQPLESGSELLETLEAWFAHDFDRRATAADLVIHPNTLDYRLRRIAELTALDLRTAEAIQLLGAAILARRQACSGDEPAGDGVVG